MKKNMPIGISDFKDVREHYYFVDKTAFIQQVLDAPGGVTLITRPRRFGKTLTMSMLDYFFSIDKREKSTGLFSGLAIERAGAAYMSRQNTYPVIFMTLKDCGETTWSETYEAFQLLMQIEFQKHDYLLRSPALPAEEKERIQRFLRLTATAAEYKRSLWYLSSYLYRYFGRKPLILIDEYDAPLQYAYTNGFYQAGMDFFRRWFSIALKENEYLEFAILTGVLRIAKESIFSGLNNLHVCSVLSQAYSDVFGFTPQEVAQIARDLDCEANLNELKMWYDGYRFGQTEIYNPWSVANYFSSACTPQPYWVNTSANIILREAIYPARLQALQQLMAGKTIQTVIDEGVIYNNIRQSDSALYTMLLTTGYLTAVQRERPTAGLEVYALQIPNLEIRQVYAREILAQLSPNVNLNVLASFPKDVLTGNGVRVEQVLRNILLHLTSVYDTASGENFYHGLMLGLSCVLYGQGYEVQSNRESGKGRFDLAVFPDDTTQAGVIMEFKKAPTESGLAEKAGQALRQIISKQYDVAFKARGIQKIWKYGIAFCGKNVCVVVGGNEYGTICAPHGVHETHGGNR